jgi:hypothetical protein
MRAEAPVVAIIADAEVAAEGIFAFLQPFDKPAANVDRADVREDAVGNYRLLHALFVFTCQADLEIDFAEIQADLHRHP